MDAVVVVVKCWSFSLHIFMAKACLFFWPTCKMHAQFNIYIFFYKILCCLANFLGHFWKFIEYGDNSILFVKFFLGDLHIFFVSCILAQTLVVSRILPPRSCGGLWSRFFLPFRQKNGFNKKMDAVVVVGKCCSFSLHIFMAKACLFFWSTCKMHTKFYVFFVLFFL